MTRVETNANNWSRTYSTFVGGLCNKRTVMKFMFIACISIDFVYYDGVNVGGPVH